MRTEGSPTKIRESCSSDMNDLRNQENFDFVPKSDYSKKWHLENKCLFHNQKPSEDEKCETGKYCPRSTLTCNFCSHSEHKLNLKLDEINFNKKSGDWKYEDDLFEQSLLKSTPYDFTSYDLKSKNPYDFSDFDRTSRWNEAHFTSTNSFTRNLLHDVYQKVDNRIIGITNGDSSKNFLQNFREYLVSYQESCGVPRTEYSFSALIKIMGQATGRSLFALLYVMLNIIPVVEVFLYILRFVLDKTISIKNTQDFRQTMIQCFVFIVELISVYTCLIFIFGFIVLPTIKMVLGIIAKILLYN